jgi:hypothetical protein
LKSNSVVTRALTDAELSATNFRTRIFLTDTRTLRLYYRLLPDKRLQIGSLGYGGSSDCCQCRYPFQRALLSVKSLNSTMDFTLAITGAWWVTTTNMGITTGTISALWLRLNSRVLTT